MGYSFASVTLFPFRDLCRRWRRKQLALVLNQSQSLAAEGTEIAIISHLQFVPHSTAVLLPRPLIVMHPGVVGSAMRGIGTGLIPCSIRIFKARKQAGDSFPPMPQLIRHRRKQQSAATRN